MGNKIKDLVGKRFGMLSVLSITDKRDNKKSVWVCLCDCGKTTEVRSTYLISGHTKSCGCLAGRNYNLSNVIVPEGMKFCNKCKNVKLLEDFPRDSSQDDGMLFMCKTCINKYNEKYNPIRAENARNRYNSDINYRMRNILRKRVRCAISMNEKFGSTSELVGCSIDYLRDYLESKFDENMSWDNYGSYWHIDHIKPCAAFDMSLEDEQRRCFHYSNLQPLEATENMKKGARY